jgi:hypothetical protein
LAALAPVGALGAAGSATQGVVNAASHVLGTHSRPTASYSPAKDQYNKACPKGTKRKGKKCLKVKKKAKGARISRRGPRFTG